MTFRTTLLAVCMVFVPAVALFSHRVPAGIRASVREGTAAGLAWCRDAVFRPVPPVVDRDAVPERAGDRSPPREPAGTVDVVTPSHQAGPTENAAELLAGLGATSLECRPLPGAPGGHVASCTMPLDADGQLLRVFHATGGDPAAAFAALHAEVDGWRRRSAPARQAATSPHPSLH